LQVAGCRLQVAGCRFESCVASVRGNFQPATCNLQQSFVKLVKPRMRTNGHEQNPAKREFKKKGQSLQSGENLGLEPVPKGRNRELCRKLCPELCRISPLFAKSFRRSLRQRPEVRAFGTSPRLGNPLYCQPRPNLRVYWS
jgi:hypothetical protein